MTNLQNCKILWGQFAFQLKILQFGSFFYITY